MQGGKREEKERKKKKKRIIQFESFAKQKKLSLETDMPPTVNGNGKKSNVFASAALRVIGSDCQSVFLHLRMQRIALCH